jgi:hypothetical protein
MGKIRVSKQKIRVSKPCHILNYCPYGPLVEQFPLEHTGKSCTVFQHDCPVWSVSEDVMDTSEKAPFIEIWTERQGNGFRMKRTEITGTRRKR